ncbi:Olfactory receptor 51B4 [Camelus dromedarius]|uniref:Olfactory receptor 51B4 n=1 Tax=Camelus dromedarius TaxID=9838 RepID=A0A5N4DMY8_CAMDR|nr:Olfactory receptor 51B4 [Camelus dromedarius]
MYYFLAILAATDLGVTLTTMPTVLGALWLDHREISHGACYFQAYLTHSLSVVESGVLLVMAYDHFIAIRNPLRYTSILTNTKLVKIVYVSVLLGNGILLYLIKDDHGLHEPIYYFLAMLAGTDLMMTLTTMPTTVMGIASDEERAKSLNTCISHISCVLIFYVTVMGLSFIHRFGKNVPQPSGYEVAPRRSDGDIDHDANESGVLLAMAYDRFIAIRTPLRYNSILTNSRVMKDVMKLACADITFNHVYPVILVALTFFLDALIIFFSYILILKTVMVIASGEARAKALNTCVSHISCVLVFYITVIGLTFIHRFGKHAPHVVHVTMSYVYFLFPPFMNPIIYSIKTKQIQRSIVCLFSVHSRA